MTEVQAFDRFCKVCGLNGECKELCDVVKRFIERKEDEDEDKA